MTEQQGYRYRLFSPLGIYPKQSLRSDLGYFCFDQDCIAVAVDELAPGDYELKLQAAILLALKEDNGFIKLYPFPYQHQLIVDDAGELDGAQLCADIKQKKSSQYRGLEETIPEFDLYENAKGASLPMILGGTLYNAVEKLVNKLEFIVLSEKLKEQKSEALNLCLSSLLASNQLSCHLQFQQQTNLNIINSLLFYAKFRQESSGKKIANPSLAEIILGYQSSNCSESYKQQLAKDMSPKEYIKLYQALCNNLKKDLLS